MAKLVVGLAFVLAVGTLTSCNSTEASDRGRFESDIGFAPADPFVLTWSREIADLSSASVPVVVTFPVVLWTVEDGPLPVVATSPIVEARANGPPCEV